jgi:hypothetical protein
MVLQTSQRRGSVEGSMQGSVETGEILHPFTQ